MTSLGLLTEALEDDIVDDRGRIWIGDGGGPGTQAHFVIPA
jgi:hypothetical protein